MSLQISPTSRQPRRERWTLEKLTLERSIALGYAIDPSTTITYTSALQSYLTFCKLHEFSTEPTPDTLSFYIVFMSHHIKPASVESYLSGIFNQLESYYPFIRQTRAAPLVRKTLAGMKKLRGTPIKRRHPLGIDDIRRIVRSLEDSPAHDDLLFLTQLLTGFFALMRAGELVWPDSRAKQDERKLSWRHTARVHGDSYEFFLPGHKADRFFEGARIVVQGLHAIEDPLLPFIKYLRSRDMLFRFKPELWLRANGTIPTYSWFRARLASFFPHGALIGGQSMRAGGATRLAILGATDDHIQASGRWSSDAFRIYIRKNPIILQSLIRGNPAFQAPI